MSGLNKLVGVLKAAGESTRLRLLALLADGDHSVKDLTEILDQSQPRVSRHLKLLADAGLVQRHAEGAWAYYRLAPEGQGADLARWLTARVDPHAPERQRDKARQAEARAAQQAQAADYFAKVAESWDLLKTLHVPEAAVEAAVLAELGGRKVDLLVDLGTGTGRMLEVLAPAYARGIGVDSSREMLGVARSRLAAWRCLPCPNQTATAPMIMPMSSAANRKAKKGRPSDSAGLSALNGSSRSVTGWRLATESTMRMMATGTATTM